jgi:hypothetical protein
MAGCAPEVADEALDDLELAMRLVVEDFEAIRKLGLPEPLAQ